MESGEEFRKWLSEYVAQLAPGTRLPPDTELAATWHLSPRTIRRIMAPLRRQGILVRIQGKGTFTPGPTRPTEPPREHRDENSVARLTRSLAESIHRGELRRGDPLPQVKFVCLQYHVSEKTVSAAYRKLSDEGLVRRIGKRYWVGALMPALPPSVRREAWVVVSEPSDLPHVYTDDTMAQAYQKMERELRSCGLLLRYTTRAELADLQRRWISTEDYPAGVVLWNFKGDDYGSVAPLVRPLVGPVGQPRTSVLIDLEDVGELRQAPPRIQVLSRGNLTTGESRSTASVVVASNAAEVVLLFEGPYSKQLPRKGILRYYKTIYEVMELVGKNRTIHPVLVTSDRTQSESWIQRRVFDPEPGYVEYLKGKYAKVARGDRWLEPKPLVLRDFDEVVRRFGRSAMWICTRANLLGDALETLGRLKVRVPDEISVVTLEDDPQFYHLGVTACAPDWDLAGYLMAHAILGDFPLAKTHRRFIRVACPVIERLTTPRH